MPGFTVEYRRPDMDWHAIKNSDVDDLPEDERRRIMEEYNVDEDELAVLYDDLIDQL